LSELRRLIRWKNRSALFNKKWRQPIEVDTISFPMAYTLVSVVGLYFLFVEFLLVDGTPAIDDVGEDEWNEERNVEHSAQGELATA